MSLSRIFGSSAIPSARELMYPSSRLFRLFEDPFFDQSFPTPLSSNLANTVFTRTPTFDVKETDKEFVLHGELPGVDKKNLSLEFIDPQTLSVRGTIEKLQEYGSPAGQQAAEGSQATESTSTDVTNASAENTVAQQGRQPTYWASERVYGEFSRAFKFPSLVDSEHVSASLKNGVLNIKVPKVGETASKRIEVLEE
ncbi:HSP20-like chaperone [Lipomyces chichibuensis]|uniref:HSP20-like chaperone n=1 Tax=Lipomyces chichibuensis TaxID=1546026 RepID=UPI003344112D